MSLIHNEGVNKHRMPVFMQPKDALRWIDETLTDEQVKDILNYEIPSESLTTYPVYMIRATRERPDGKEKFEEFKYENLPELENDKLRLLF